MHLSQPSQSSGTIVALFDDGKSRLGPLGDLRASFEQRLGVQTGIERAHHVLGRVDALFPPEHLLAVVTERYANQPLSIGQFREPSGEVILINGALDSLCDAATLELGDVVLSADGRVAMARMSIADARKFLERDAASTRVPANCKQRKLTNGCMIGAPWDLLARLPHSVPADISLLSRSGEMTDRHSTGVVRFGHQPLYMDPTAKVLPGAIIDCSEGAVLLGPGAIVRPGAVVCGPAAVLGNSTVMDRAHIKARTVIGPDCKVGGEVGSTVFQAHSNKAHEGHLGDALVGEWVNIGAGSCNSNLLNTYGDVVTRLDAAGGFERTGRQFYGGVIGDHAKIAILVAMTTGSTIGTGALIASARPPAFVERFAWLTPEKDGSFRFPRFEETMRAVMGRRSVTPGRAYLERLRALHEAHSHNGSA